MEQSCLFCIGSLTDKKAVSKLTGFMIDSTKCQSLQPLWLWKTIQGCIVTRRMAWQLQHPHACHLRSDRPKSLHAVQQWTHPHHTPYSHYLTSQTTTASPCFHKHLASNKSASRSVLLSTPRLLGSQPLACILCRPDSRFHCLPSHLIQPLTQQ